MMCMPVMQLISLQLQEHQAKSSLGLNILLLAIQMQQNLSFLETSADLRNYEQELRSQEQANSYSSSENAALLERVKTKWREGQQLKKRLSYLESLEKILTVDPEKAQQTSEAIEQPTLQLKKQEVHEESPMQAEIKALEKQFTALLIKSREITGSSKERARVQLAELAIKIRRVKSQLETSISAHIP